MRKNFTKPTKRFFTIVAFLFGTSRLAAQESIPGQPIICYHNATHSSAHLAASQANARLQQTKASFEVTYVDFPEAAKKAFSQAITIWETSISSAIPIRIRATWTALEGNALASTRASKLYRSFDGAATPDMWYPVALAEKLAGRELNTASETDIEISVNQNIAWYLGTDGATPGDRSDLVSIVLHEIAHGLGFSSTARVDNEYGLLRDEQYLLVYDALLENRQQKRLAAFTDSTRELYSQFTSDNLYLHSTTAARSNLNQFPKVYAPGFFNSGSSISHLDESTFPSGDPNSLMTPSFSIGESIHQIGPIALGVLADLGWNDSQQDASQTILFPNPSTGIYYLRLPIHLQATAFRVVDAIGREVLMDTQTLRGANPLLDLSSLAKGVYGIIISTQNGTIQGELKRKVVLMR